MSPLNNLLGAGARGSADAGAPLELCTQPRTGPQGKRARKPGVSAMLIIELEVILADGLVALLHRDLIE